MDVMGNLLALCLTFLVVAGSLLISFLLYKYTKISKETVRKFVHICVSNTAFIIVYGFTHPLFAIGGPILFTLVNVILLKCGFGKYIGMNNRLRDNGVIYFPFSLTILVILKYLNIIGDSEIIIGMLIMGYGDGLAAIIGSSMGKTKIFNTGKTVEGSLIMFIVSIIVISIFASYLMLKIVIIALVVTLTEAFTKRGLDNITVPIFSALLGAFL